MQTTTQTLPATTAPAKPATAKVSVIGALAGRLNCDPAKLTPLLKKTAFATCRTDEEFMAMCMVANTYNLNPILKEVYAFPAQKGQVVPIVGVDGWIKLMNANPAFDGIEFDETPEACTCIIHRKDRSHPVKVTEWLAECGGTTEPWRRWPRRMLRHKAMIQAARIAFGFSGIYDEDEAQRIASTALADPEPEATPAAKPKGGARLRAALGITGVTPANDPATLPEPEAGPESAPAKSARERPSDASEAAGGKNTHPDGADATQGTEDGFLAIEDVL